MCFLEKYPKNCHEGKNLTTLSVVLRHVQLHIDALAIPQAHNYMCMQLHNTTRRTVQALKTSPDAQNSQQTLVFVEEQFVLP